MIVVGVLVYVSYMWWLWWWWEGIEGARGVVNSNFNMRLRLVGKETSRKRNECEESGGARCCVNLSFNVYVVVVDIHKFMFSFLFAIIPRMNTERSRRSERGSEEVLVILPVCLQSTDKTKKD